MNRFTMTVTALVLLGINMWLSGSFYAESVGGGYWLVGVAITLFEAVTLSLSFSFFSANKPWFGLAMGGFFLMCLAATMMTHQGKFSIAQSQDLLDGDKYIEAKKELNAAQSALLSFSGVSTQEAIREAIKAKELQRDNLLSARDGLPKNYGTKRGELDKMAADVNAEISVLGAAIGAAIGAARAHTRKATAQARYDRYSNDIGGGLGALSQTISDTAALFGFSIAPRSAFAWFSVLVAFLFTVGVAVSVHFAGLTHGIALSVVERGEELAGEKKLKTAIVETGNLSALRGGGRIKADGLAELHAAECVLCPEATAWLDKNFKGLLDAANKKDWALVMKSLGAARSNPLGAASSKQLLGAVTLKAKKIIIVGARVPKGLEGKAGKKRVGRVDTCIDCPDDFVVSAYNGKRCKPCAVKAENSFRMAQTNGKLS